MTSKSRTCTQPMPMFGGRRCVRFGPPVETKECNMHECPAPKSKLIFDPHKFINKFLNTDLPTIPQSAPTKG